MKQLSHLAQNLSESATIKMAQMARDLAAKGVDVISLSLGEPDFDTPAHIKEAAKKALDEGYTKYTAVPGLPELREAIITKLKRDNGMEFSADQIVVSNGAKQSIANLCLALLNPGDEVALFTPYWVSYHDIIKMTGAHPVEVAAGIDQDFKVLPEQLEAAITERTKMILFSSPCNPTGSVYSEQELRALAKVVEKYPDLIVVSDEIYEYINFTHQHFSIGSIEAIKNQVVTVNGFSKGFAMTGWRLGYLAAPKWLAASCSKIQGQFTSGAASFSQKAGATALLSDLSPTFKMKEAFQKRRDLVIELMSSIPGFQSNIPEGAFYIFPNVASLYGKTTPQGDIIEDSSDLALYFLSEAHVAVVAGEAFGAPDCIRLSFAASEEELTRALLQIKEAVQALN